mmetsp:Transcript_8873/g.12642  ORF Transcript_8873/g.12642 Transcript_8873/m.12642 type:complete len:619 (-) Transcript_8873:185-2041(-)|eukprot:CAMPEP_0184865844 /NCGR_PEP_ID=MMETSP0580-20130426/19388_1 /TAXON_ID=1118495 /ORGANISM="Dactyliosolen fragilissimus" /LENGTH=618 /DNA_ID=CAMNT_0027365213 /DNA_START=117 /DNA_END=1973 /DNA_ORIENTATION=+
MTAILSQVLRKKPLHSESAMEDDANTDPKLLRTLDLPDIILYGVGCSVGAGIYSLVGIGAELAGPAISVSFILCAIACMFTGLTYAEFAGRIPTSGSAYAFTYVAIGELPAWLVGWNMTLGYGISSAVVARSWAQYLFTFLKQSIRSEKVLLIFGWLNSAKIPLFGEDYSCCPLSALLIAACTFIILTGAKESARFNSIMTLVNLSMLGIVVFSGIDSINVDNLVPFAPKGLAGIARGSGFVFFAYIGFDMVSCLSEEAKNPQKNMPRGIVGSLLASMTIYVVVALVVVGMAPLKLLGPNVPITNAMLANACCTHKEQLLSPGYNDIGPMQCLDIKFCDPVLRPMLLFGVRLVSFGAIFGLTTAAYTGIMGQPRIFYSMARDGLLFSVFGKVDQRSGVPKQGIIITGLVVAVTACFVDLEALADVISLGTLQVFTFVNAGVIILRADDNNKHSKDAAKDGKLSNATKSIAGIISFTLSITIAKILYEQNLGITLIGLFLCFAILSAVWLQTVPMHNVPESFKCPSVPTVPLLGIAFNTYMMLSLPLVSWLSIFLYLLVGIAVYYFYGMTHSKLGLQEKFEAHRVSTFTSRTSSSLDNETSSLLFPDDEIKNKYDTLEL